MKHVNLRTCSMRKIEICLYLWSTWFQRTLVYLLQSF